MGYMNTYKYKIHYKKYDFQIGGQAIPAPVYMNQLTQQQVLLAQLQAQQQQQQQQTSQKNKSTNNLVPLQVHTINELFLRVENNNDLAIYMLDYIKAEKIFFDNNEMLTTENNIFCTRILEKCLNAAKKYSVLGNPYWLRVLQFLKYLNKNNKE